MEEEKKEPEILELVYAALKRGILYLGIIGIFLTPIIRAFYWLKTGESMDIDIKSLPSFNPEYWGTDDWEGLNQILTRFTDCEIELFFLLSIALRAILAAFLLLLILLSLPFLPVFLFSLVPRPLALPPFMVIIGTPLAVWMFFLFYRKTKTLGLRRVQFGLVVILSTVILALLSFLLKWIRDS